MLLYIEKSVFENERVQAVLRKYPHADILKIDNYKNLFDKNIA